MIQGIPGKHIYHAGLYSGAAQGQIIFFNPAVMLGILGIAQFNPNGSIGVFFVPVGHAHGHVHISGTGFKGGPSKK